MTSENDPTLWQKLIEISVEFKTFGTLMTAGFIALAGYRFDKFKQARKDRDIEFMKMQLLVSKIPEGVFTGEDHIATHAHTKGVVDECSVNLKEQFNDLTGQLRKANENFLHHVENNTE